jgi:5-formyltetrahydrofolate cyclo-ligase
MKLLPRKPAMTITDEKALLRKKMHALRDGLPSEVRRAAAGHLALLAEAPRFRAFLPAPGGVIAGFSPIRSEIDPLPLMARLAREGFRLALPRIAPEGLVFHAYDPGQALTAGPLGTREPSPDWPVMTPDLILAPLLAFDDAGGRLGYGKAYYDRVFAAFPAARRVGLAFSVQRVPTVPCAAHDARLEAVFTQED